MSAKKKPQTEDKFNFRLRVYNSILWIVILGLFVPYLCQFVLPFFFPCYKIAGIELWNQFTSTILGIVATIMSVVSLYLCFKSQDDSRDTEIRTRDLLDKISAKIDLLQEKQNQIYEQMNSNDYSNNQRSETLINKEDWNNSDKHTNSNFDVLDEDKEGE